MTNPKVDDELRNTTAFLDSIVENIPLMVFVKDAELLRFERINRAGEELLGLGREELIGKSDHDFFTKEQADFFQAKDRETLALGALVDVAEEPIVTKRGLRWLRTMKMAIRDEQGTAKYLLGISEDITSKREMAETLRLAEENVRRAQRLEAVGRFAGAIAHDFNNLLSVILSYTALNLGEVKPGDPLHADLREVQRAGERAADLARQLLAFSRQRVLEPHVLDLNLALGRQESMLRRLLGESVQLTLLTASGLGEIVADPGQLEQVIMNLAVNARDAMPDGGTLTIETANVDIAPELVAGPAGVVPGPYVRLSVIDSGVGMDDATRERIFEPFFTTKEPGKGTGLGLATVFGIVQQSGGAISVESKPGHGTTFDIYLPRAAASEITVALSMKPEPARGGSETILVVEDDDSLRAVVRTILRRAGYTAVEAQNGGEALLVCEEHPAPIHLLLTDIVMPRMNGPRLAERLANLRPQMRVMFMSGSDEALELHGLIEAGAAFLRKPITPDSLLRKVRGVLDAGDRAWPPR